MTRLLLLLAIAVGVILWWKHSQRGRRSGAAPSEAPPSAMPESMLRCAECGLHLPASQALPGRGGSFCSAEHREAFEARSER